MSAVVDRFFWCGGIRGIKNAVSLVFSIISKFLKYEKKYNLQSQRLYINCAYTGRGCKLISVSTHMDYLFSTGNVNVFFPALCRFHHFICELIKWEHRDKSARQNYGVTKREGQQSGDAPLYIRFSSLFPFHHNNLKLCDLLGSK